MRNLVPFIVLGLATGSVYGLAGVGLVLTYRTSGVFNFAYGSVASVGADVFYELRVREGWNAVPAVVVAVVGVGVVGGLLLELLGRRLARSSLAYSVVATVGLILAIQGLALLRYGAAALDVPPYFPTRSIRVLGANVGVDKIIVMAIGLAAAGSLYGFLRSSRLGTQMRAVVQSPELVSLTGAAPVRIARWAWVIGTSLASLSGVLLVPSIGLDPTLLTLLVVQAFGAAAVGAFSSLPVSYAGGLAIGVAAAVSTKYVGQVPALQGMPTSLPFIVLFVVLLVIPRSRLAEASPRRQVVSHRETRSSRPVRLGAGGLVLAVLLAVPWMVGTKLAVYNNGLVYVLLFMSLYLLVRVSGQVSLCHAGFAAVGAAAFAHLTHGLGVPWAVGLVLGGLFAVPVGALVAVPAIRLSGLYLAIATFGFGILIQDLFYGRSFMFGANGSLVVGRPHWGGAHLYTDRGFYYVLLSIGLLGAAGLTLVIRTRLGRLLRALSDSPAGLAAQGVNTNLTRIWAFCISAFVAGVAGGLMGSLTGSVNGTPFNPFLSLELLAVLIIGGRSAYRSTVGGAVAVAVIPGYFTSATLNNWLTVGFGVSAIAATVMAGGSLGRRLALPGAAVPPVRYGRREKSPVTARLEQARLEQARLGP